MKKFYCNKRSTPSHQPQITSFFSKRLPELSIFNIGETDENNNSDLDEFLFERTSHFDTQGQCSSANFAQLDSPFSSQTTGDNDPESNNTIIKTTSNSSQSKFCWSPNETGEDLLENSQNQNYSNSTKLAPQNKLDSEIKPKAKEKISDTHSTNNDCKPRVNPASISAQWSKIFQRTRNDRFIKAKSKTESNKESPLHPFSLPEAIVSLKKQSEVQDKNYCRQSFQPMKLTSQRDHFQESLRFQWLVNINKGFFENLSLYTFTLAADLQPNSLPNNISHHFALFGDFLLQSRQIFTKKLQKKGFSVTRSLRKSTSLIYGEHIPLVSLKQIINFKRKNKGYLIFSEEEATLQILGESIEAAKERFTPYISQNCSPAKALYGSQQSDEGELLKSVRTNLPFKKTYRPISLFELVGHDDAAFELYEALTNYLIVNNSSILGGKPDAYLQSHRSLGILILFPESVGGRIFIEMVCYACSLFPIFEEKPTKANSSINQYFKNTYGLKPISIFDLGKLDKNSLPDPKRDLSIYFHEYSFPDEQQSKVSFFNSFSFLVETDLNNLKQYWSDCLSSIDDLKIIELHKTSLRGLIYRGGAIVRNLCELSPSTSQQVLSESLQIALKNSSSIESLLNQMHWVSFCPSLTDYSTQSIEEITSSILQQPVDSPQALNEILNPIHWIKAFENQVSLQSLLQEISLRNVDFLDSQACPLLQFDILHFHIYNIFKEIEEQSSLYIYPIVSSVIENLLQISTKTQEVKFLRNIWNIPCLWDENFPFNPLHIFIEKPNSISSNPNLKALEANIKEDNQHSDSTFYDCSLAISNHTNWSNNAHPCTSEIHPEAYYYYKIYDYMSLFSQITSEDLTFTDSNYAEYTDVIQNINTPPHYTLPSTSSIHSANILSNSQPSISLATPSTNNGADLKASYITYAPHTAELYADLALSLPIYLQHLYYYNNKYSQAQELNPRLESTNKSASPFSFQESSDSKIDLDSLRKRYYSEFLQSTQSNERSQPPSPDYNNLSDSITSEKDSYQINICCTDSSTFSIGSEMLSKSKKRYSNFYDSHVPYTSTTLGSISYPNLESLLNENYDTISYVSNMKRPNANTIKKRVDKRVNAINLSIKSYRDKAIHCWPSMGLFLKNSLDHILDNNTDKRISPQINKTRKYKKENKS